MGGTVLNHGMQNLVQGINWSTDTFKIVLMRNGTQATIQQDTTQYISDMVSLSSSLILRKSGVTDKAQATITVEVSSTGTGKLFLKDSETSRSIPNVNSNTVEGFLLYKSSSLATNSPLICYNTLVSNVKPVQDTSFKVTYNTNGILLMSAADV